VYEIPLGFTLFRNDLEHIESSLASQFSKLEGARIFITGGTGFFGVWMLEGLLWAIEKNNLDIDLIVLSRDPEAFFNTRAPHLRNRKHLNLIKGELDNFVFPETSVTHILHIASESNKNHSSKWALQHLNSSINGTSHLLNMAVEKQVEAVLITTSGAVYSTTEQIVNDRFKEGPNGIEDYTSERSVYGQSKRMMEVMTTVTAQTNNFRALIARCFCFVGPYLPLDANYAVGNFIRDALKGGSIIINGDGSPLRSYLYPSDLIIWLIMILVRGKSGVPYNVGGDYAISIENLARMVASEAGNGSSIQIMQSRSGGPINTYLPDLTRVTDELDLMVTVDIRMAIKRTLDWNSMLYKC
jgi:dTDP-glucose 4,6-dehydratase